MKQLQQTITTLDIAEMLNMKHWQILRKLEGTKNTKGIIKILNDNKIVVVNYFIKSAYTDDKGEERPCYKVTKLGCDFLANKFSGEKGVVFTALYVKRFADMEQHITSQLQPALPQQETYLLRNSPTWFQRNNSKMKMICDYFYWTRKHLYHKILQEVSDIYSLENVEELFISDYGKRPFYKMDLIEYYPPLQEVAISYIDHLMNFIED